MEVMLERNTRYALDNDEQLVSRLARGDADALGVLWDRHARLAYSLALRMLRDSGWAEEVVQDVFIRLWSKPRMYDPSRGDLRRWMLTITHHAAVDGLRGRRGSARSRDAGPEGLESVSDRNDDPAENTWKNVRAEHVQIALSRLPSAQREVMELVYFQGLTQLETAEHTGLALGTVKSRLRLGMQKLRGSLAEIGTAE